MPKSDNKSERRVLALRPDARLLGVRVSDDRRAPEGFQVVSYEDQSPLGSVKKTSAEAWRSALGRLTS